LRQGRGRDWRGRGAGEVNVEVCRVSGQGEECDAAEDDGDCAVLEGVGFGGCLGGGCVTTVFAGRDSGWSLSERCRWDGRGAAYSYSLGGYCGFLGGGFLGFEARKELVVLNVLLHLGASKYARCRRTPRQLALELPHMIFRHAVSIFTAIVLRNGRLGYGYETC
jgi:hypothetical protein